MKVYVVTQGEYSDYHICGVALDEERAEAIKKHFNVDNEWEQTNIEVYDTETYNEGNLLTIYYINISKSGDDVDVFNETPIAPVDRLNNSYRFDNRGDFIACVTAKDRDHALKIAFDKRAKMLAEKLLV